MGPTSMVLDPIPRFTFLAFEDSPPRATRAVPRAAKPIPTAERTLLAPGRALVYINRRGVPTVIERTALLLLLLCAATSAAEVLVADYDGDMEFTDPHAGGLVGSEYAILNALDANGRDYDLVTHIGDLAGYDIVFVLLGTFPT